MGFMITQDNLHNKIFKEPRSSLTGRTFNNYQGGKDRFRLKDGDDLIYFYGLSDDSETESGFDPLDWAMPLFGCTTIEYKDPKTGEYRPL